MRLRELRDLRGLTQSDVSTQIGIAQNTYSQYETGKREPDMATLVKLADFFGVSTDYLLGKDDRGKAIDQAIADIGKGLNGYGAMFYGPNGEHVWKEFSSKEEYETYLRLVGALTNKEN